MRKILLGLAVAAGVLGLATKDARADDAVIAVSAPERFAEPPAEARAPIVIEDSRFERPEKYRSNFRLELGPTTITTGKGLGVGVGIGADFGSGSVGGRIYATWLRGEGTKDGTDTASIYGTEVTLDLHKRGPIHPVIGTGIAIMRVTRTDTDGFAGVGTGRFTLDYALNLDDADVRIGGDIQGGLIGPQDNDIKNLHAYGLFGAHLAIGF